MVGLDRIFHKLLLLLLLPHDQSPLTEDVVIVGIKENAVEANRDLLLQVDDLKVRALTEKPHGISLVLILPRVNVLVVLVADIVIVLMGNDLTIVAVHLNVGPLLKEEIAPGTSLDQGLLLQNVLNDHVMPLLRVHVNMVMLAFIHTLA